MKKRNLLKMMMTAVCMVFGSATASAQEPYAVLSEDKTVLTFYFDENKEINGGMDVGPFTITNFRINSGWSSNRKIITEVVFDDSFADCTSITSTAGWFYDCNNLQTITGISNFNTENVTDMSFMFFCCYNMTSLDLSSFNTENVVSMDNMFSSCSSLTSLDLQSFKTTSLITMYYMFESDASLETIYVDGNNWILTSQMFGGDVFKDCTSLIGGNGTAYDEIHVAHEYACVDKEGQPGYLTDIVSLGISDTHRLSDKKQTNNDKWYSLNGRRVQGVPMQKGVYIYKGKKVVKE